MEPTYATILLRKSWKSTLFVESATWKTDYKLLPIAPNNVQFPTLEYLGNEIG